jgi:ABC-type uncharacterized transport system ATPase component
MMLALDKIDKYYPTWGKEKLCVLSQFSLAVNQGEVVRIAGGNGSGKTTILKIIAALEAPDAGHIFIDDVDVTNQSLHERSVLVRISAQNPLLNLFPDLTLLENLMLARSCRDSGNKKPKFRILKRKANDFLTAFFPSLSDKLKAPVVTFSGGQCQLASVAVALWSTPKILLLDEVTSQLSSEHNSIVTGAIKAFMNQKDHGSTDAIVLTGHNIGQLEEIVSRTLTLMPFPVRS